jgi:hypothetical protein
MGEDRRKQVGLLEIGRINLPYFKGHWRAEKERAAHQPELREIAWVGE